MSDREYITDITIAPGEVIELMEIYALPTRDREPEACPTMIALVQKGLVTAAGDALGRKHRVTEKGEKFIDMILHTPLPKQEWIDPRIKVE